MLAEEDEEVSRSHIVMDLFVLVLFSRQEPGNLVKRLLTKSRQGMMTTCPKTVNFSQGLFEFQVSHEYSRVDV